MTRRALLSGALGSAVSARSNGARIAITLDLEMSANFPTWEHTNWNFEKGNLDEDTKRYAVRAAELVQDHGARIHFFVVGSVLEQEDVSWLERIAKAGHPIGNHTYDHVNLLARSLREIQYRFQRAPWLIEGSTVEQALENNIALTTSALRTRIGVEPAGFRTPGGFAQGLTKHPDLQRMLLRQGFRWCSSQYPGTEPFRYPATGLLEIPMSPVSDIAAFRNRRWTLEQFLASTRISLEQAIERGTVYDFLAHPSCLVTMDPSMKTLELICRNVTQAKDRARLVTLTEVAGEYLT